MKTRTYNRKKLIVVVCLLIALAAALLGRLGYIMIAKSQYYKERADALHERERSIKAKRGVIYDRNGVILADNKSVCTISVIHNQITDPEKVISVLSEVLEIDEETIRKRVEKVSSIERIKSNVPKETGDIIRTYKLDGVTVDEDYSRTYPFNELASKVLGFTGGDNQGIIGLEVVYDEYLQGEEGFILTTTDARGIEVVNEAEKKVDPVDGNSLVLSLDYNIQMYAQQAAQKVMEAKEAKAVSVILMNPQNGEIYAMVNAPEFNLNEPYTLNSEEAMSDEEKQDALNHMWRNGVLNDTYEPGSTFKIITSVAALETGSVSLTDQFSCPGFRIVEDRRIKCSKTTGHGAETFVQGFMNSCNPVFIDVGARTGVENMYTYFEKLGLFSKTGIDLPGEANSIMHKKENVGAVELATISFGQGFQITPLQLLTAVSAAVNGGTRVTPHFGVKIVDDDMELVKTLQYETKENVIKKETSDTLKELLEKVVAEGTGKNAKIDGYRIGGKTATSEKLPRSQGKYITSFIGIAPINDPKIIGIILIDEPVGVYYGGTVAAPVMKEIFENVLPYLEVEQVPVEETESQEPY